jgi:hypothetical protein
MQDPFGINSKKPKTKEVESIVAYDVKPRPLHWLWYGHLLRGTLHLISGQPNIGKSQIECSLIACVTTTKPWPDGDDSGPPANVIMVVGEDVLDQIIIPRLIAAGVDLKRVRILKRIKEDGKGRRFLLGEDLDELEKLVAEVGDVALIVVDPITSFMGGSIDSHKATAVRSQLDPLQDLAEKLNIVVSAVTHPPKKIGERALDLFLGSQAFIAAPRTGHVCLPEHDDDGDATGRTLLLAVKYSASARPATLAYRIEAVTVSHPDSPFCKLPISKVVWDKDPVDVTADEAAAVMATKGKRETKRKAINDFLSEILKDGKPVASTTIYAEGAKRGFSEWQLKYAKKNFKGGTIEDVLPDGVGGVHAWMLIPF